MLGEGYRRRERQTKASPFGILGRVTRGTCLAGENARRIRLDNLASNESNLAYRMYLRRKEEILVFKAQFVE